jgi:competence protein ComEC
LDKTLRHHFQASGAAHVLAVSGLHTGIIYAILAWLMTLGGRYKPLYENRAGRAMISLAIIGVMWGYAWLTGMTPSVVRAVVMVSLYEGGKILHRNSPTLNTIAAAAVLILLVRPSDLWSVSFQLSFAATFAIVIMANGEWTRWRMPKIAKYVLGIIVVSLAAQLGTLPITMFYFKQVSCYFLLANLCVLPIATLLVPCGLISIALGGSIAGVYFSKITWSLAWLMNHSVAWIERLPGCTLPAHIDGTMVGIYYVLLLAFCFFFRKGIKA